MNILLVAPQPFFMERGTPIAVRLLVETLCELGHAVDLLVYHQGQDIQVENMRLVRARRPPGVREVPIGISVSKLLCDAMLVSRMIGMLRRNKYDVIHAVEEAIFPAVVLNARSRRKVVYDMDSSLVDQLVEKWRPLRPLCGLLRQLEQAAVRRATATVAVCEDLAAKVRPWVGEGRVTVLPDVPLNESAPRADVERLRDHVSPGAVLGVYVGNLERYQGIDLLLQGLARMPRDTPFRTVIIGGNDQLVAQYRRRAAELGIGGVVHFLGARPLANLGAYLEQADVLVSPRTLGQNTPMKIYSYMQAGKAILATDIRSHTQALDDTCAYLVQTEPARLADGLARLAGDPALRERLGAAARQRAEREYSLTTYRRKLRDLYERLARD
jgi:glycosyltransferase involved in cell wall biosynthesis